MPAVTVTGRRADPEPGDGAGPEPGYATDPRTDPAPTDAELLRAHVAGDAEAFGELFRRHRDRLWAVAVRTMGDREEAADALQDALISAHRGAARFRGDSAVTTWLHRIVVNACLDRLRRRRAHPTVPLPDGSRSDADRRGVEPAAPAPDHDTALVVRQALAELPPEQRSALILVDVQGYPVAEAAAILGVAEGTVKSRCARGRARLAMKLGHLRSGRDVSEGRSDPEMSKGRSSRRLVGGPAQEVPGQHPDVPPVTQRNPHPAGSVRSGSAHGADGQEER